MKISISKGPKKVEKVVTISGSNQAVNRVLSLLTMVHLNGQWGHSGLFGISWDGDGADNIGLDFENIKEFIKQNKDGINACSSYGGEVEYVGEGGNYHVINAKDIQHKRVWPKEE